MKQRIVISIVVLVFGGIATALAWKGQPEARQAGYQPHGPGDIYLALGDSLATGFLLAAPERESYVAVLGAKLAEQGVVRQINLGVGGATSDTVLQRQLPQALEVIAQAQAQGQWVSPITIGIGGNDLRAVEGAGEAEREAAIQRIGSNLGTMIEALQQASSGSDIAIMTYYDPFSGDPSIIGSDAYWIERLNDAIRYQAMRHEIAIAEVYTAFGRGHAYEYTNVLLGDIHANTHGHAVIAAQFWQALSYP